MTREQLAMALGVLTPEHQRRLHKQATEAARRAAGLEVECPESSESYDVEMMKVSDAISHEPTVDSV